MCIVRVWVLLKSVGDALQIAGQAETGLFYETSKKPSVSSPGSEHSYTVASRPVIRRTIHMTTALVD
jgi:hypothetical protein